MVAAPAVKVWRVLLHLASQVQYLVERDKIRSTIMEGLLFLKVEMLEVPE